MGRNKISRRHEGVIIFNYPSFFTGASLAAFNFLLSIIVKNRVWGSDR